MDSLNIKQSLKNQVIFSFGQQNLKYSSRHQQQENKFGYGCKNKFQYVKRLINKYELKENISPMKLKTSSNKPRELSLSQLSKKSGNNQLSTSLNNHQHSKIQDCQSTKDQCSIFSKQKSELEQSHQNVVSKYLTPIHFLLNESTYQNADQQEGIFYQNTICEFLNSSKQFNEKDTDSYQTDSIPLIESLIMFEENNDTLAKKKEFSKEKKIQELNEFTIIAKNEINDQLKLSHIIALCLLMLVFLFWTM